MTTFNTQHPTPNTQERWQRALIGCSMLNVRRWMFLTPFLFACLGGGFAPCLLAAGSEPSTFQLHPTAMVDGEGIYLRHLVVSNAVLAGGADVDNVPGCRLSGQASRPAESEFRNSAISEAANAAIDCLCV